MRRRVYLRNADDRQDASAVHGRCFDIRPVNTLLQVAALVGQDYLMEIEVEAKPGPRS